MHIAKTPTTVDNQAFGVVSALGATGVDLRGVDLIVHGTTTTTNAVLERRLAKTGMITTRGFRDVIELGRRTRPQPYGMTGSFVPIIPRDLRLEVAERVDASRPRAHAARRGRRCAPPSTQLIGPAANPSSSISCTPTPTRRTSAAPPKSPPSSGRTATSPPGHALLSEAREFERGVTAAVNASVQPILERYVERLRNELAAHGYRPRLPDHERQWRHDLGPLRHPRGGKTVMSGPASGVIAAAYTGRRAGFENLVTYDMGGTSTDVALIRDGEPSVSNEIEIEYAMPIHVPMVDVHTVGAGGGSIARVDAAGLIQIGPESAGANPGPICYGRGGTRADRSPTPTWCSAGWTRRGCWRSTPGHDRGDPRRLRRGRSARRSASTSRRPRRPSSASPTRRWPAPSAWSRCRAATTRATSRCSPSAAPGRCMPRRWRANSACRRCWCRRGPGITNALGCVVADLRHDFVNTVNQPVAGARRRPRREVFAAQNAEGEELIAREKRSPRADPRHSLRRHAVRRPDPHHQRGAAVAAITRRRAAAKLFETAYFARFKVELPEIRANLVNLNTAVTGVRAGVDLSR